MRLRSRLGLTFGAILLILLALLAAILYREARTTFRSQLAQEAGRLAELAVDQGNRRSLALGSEVRRLAADLQIGLLVREASKNAAAQRRLIDALSDRLAASGIQELTAVSPDGVILARGHRPAEFGDLADSATPELLNLRPASTLMRLRVAVKVQGRLVGFLEGGSDISDVLAEMSRLFEGTVALSIPGDTPMAAAAAGPFEYVAIRPWRLSDDRVLADLVFVKTGAGGTAAFRRMALRVGAIFIVAFLAAGFWIARFSDTVTRPVRQLAQAAADISLGKERVEFPPRTDDEVGELTTKFSGMASSLRATQEKLLAAERLAAWQDAARMLAHEIKNPLSPIKLTASTLARASDENDPKLPDLARRGSAAILTEISHLEKLLAEFSSFARFPTPRPRPADLNRTVKAVVDSFRARSPEVGWIDHYAPDAPPVMLDEGMFSEVVSNLLKNAIEAMASRSSAERPVIRIETAVASGHASLVIADTGPGVPSDRRGNLFAPYFTTKAGGTGLGLAVSKKIMLEHGGDLALLDPSPYPDALGAAFRATVPLARVNAT